MIGFAKYRRSTFATMIGVVLLVAVVWLLLTRPAAPDPQPADFAALSAQPGVTASVKTSGGGATFQVNLDAPEQNVGQPIYTGDYGNIVLTEVTDADASGCTLHFSAGGGMDNSGKAHLISGVVPSPDADGAGDSDQWQTAALEVTPEGCTASFVAEETQYTTDGNQFAIRLETDPETGERYLTVLLYDLPEIVLTPAD